MSHHTTYLLLTTPTIKAIDYSLSIYLYTLYTTYVSFKYKNFITVIDQNKPKINFLSLSH